MQNLVQPKVVLDLSVVRDLRVEIETIEASYGSNAYSNFLRAHHRRPSREEAAEIGRLLGRQVKASDGSMQPPPSTAERNRQKKEKSLRDTFARRVQQLADIRTAVSLLAGINDSPSDVIGDRIPPLDTSVLDLEIRAALSYLSRFAEYWNDRPQSPSAQNQGTHNRD